MPIEQILEEQVEQMDAQPNRKVSWVLISTQTNEQVESLWEKLSERAVKGYWIVPAYSIQEIPNRLLQNPDVMHWEVSYGK
jgi:restriction endonuclease